jgi:hypothetical protein
VMVLAATAAANSRQRIIVRRVTTAAGSGCQQRMSAWAVELHRCRAA